MVGHSCNPNASPVLVAGSGRAFGGDARVLSS
jgi:hypothetical protein